MEISKEQKEKILNDVREHCGEGFENLTNTLLDLGGDIGFGLLMLGFEINFNATEHELLTIERVLYYLQKENAFAYKMFESVLIEMFHRKSEGILKEFLGKQKPNDDGQSN